MQDQTLTPTDTTEALQPTETTWGNAPATIEKHAVRQDKSGIHEVTVQVPNPAAQQHTAELQQVVTEVGSPAPTEVVREVGTLDDLLKQFGNADDGVLVYPFDIDGTRFYVRELDILTLMDVETQRLSTEKGQIVRKPSREIKLGLCLEFAYTVYRKTGDNPAKYEPLFTLETVQTFLKQPKAKDLIDQLANAIYTVNPSLNPMRKMALQDHQ